MSEEIRWLSATSAGRIIRCPAAAPLIASPAAIPATKPENAGTLAHLAVASWLECGAWREYAAGRALQEAWDRAAETWSVDPRRLPDGVMTRARLGARGDELAHELVRHGTRARSEVFLRDADSALYGQLDIVVDGGGGAVVDLKSGRDAAGELSNAVRVQLLVYAHLFRSEQGFLPAAVLAFSLRRGPVYLEYSPEDVDSLLQLVDEVRGASSAPAIPDEHGCRYCLRRLRCEPHWSAAAGWEAPDCVQGVVVKSERASAGVVAVLLETGVGRHWVTGLPASRAGDIGVGDEVRFAEIAGTDHVSAREWHATRATRWRVVNPEPYSPGRRAKAPDKRLRPGEWS